MRWAVIYVVLSSITGLAYCRQKLGKYKVDPTKISVSGISSGAEMATQAHVAYSATFMGVGIIGGSPYYCAQEDEIIATTDCMYSYDHINISVLVAKATTYASTSLIDLPGNLTNDRVFIFSGMKDSTVLRGVLEKVKEFYNVFVKPDNIKTVFDINAGHTFATLNFGNPCEQSKEPWIGRCNYDAAFEILDHIYGNLKRPTDNTTVHGDFYEFDQGEFFPASPPKLSSMDDTGYVYVPSGCTSAKTACKLHVVFHGCLQGKYLLKDMFARHTGYNAVGELNNIIILYPQAIAIIDNPMGCWDWWGYTVHAYATKIGNQPLAMWQMIKRIAF